MKNLKLRKLNELPEIIKDSTMVLIVNNNSKSLLEPLCNIMFKKYKSRKTKIRSTKGLYKKLLITTNKLVRIDFDFENITLNGSKSNLNHDLKILKESLTENNSRVLFKTDISKHNRTYNPKFIRTELERKYYIFDSIILIDKEIIIIKYSPTSYDCYDIGTRKFELSQLVRSSKLKKLKLFNE